ncbi:MAG: class I SAM-dependent methyltransferase [Bacteroidota bacterium]|nr:class I SAM-dependent methyltransferase [Candidatus Kapabacteria bacterium]MDW8221167.1 class I SAM-dependent methyltransferase [Bacteroidota bacterium]
MHRNITNIIRAIIDEWIPPKIRDSKWFMYPFFWYWYRSDREAIRAYMSFKDRVWSMSSEEYVYFYTTFRQKSRAAARETDLSDACVEFMLKAIDSTAQTVLDVGCGKGYWLRRLRAHGNYHLYGCDVVPHLDIGEGIVYYQAHIEALPFADKAFDVVTCHHTIEHIPRLDAALSELKRVCKKQLMIVTPCQRYYRYTLDEHVHFFPLKSELVYRIGIERHMCTNILGDWVYIGLLE